MTKKRYKIYLSLPLAQRLDLVARQRYCAKSAIIEEALRVQLEPQRYPGIDEGLARRLDDLNEAIARVGRDVAIVTETLALFVRYFLTITPVLPESEQESARVLGRDRFKVFIAQVGQRLAGDIRLVSEVLETIAVHQPDLFATASDDGLLNGCGNRKPNGSWGAEDQ